MKERAEQRDQWSTEEAECIEDGATGQNKKVATNVAAEWENIEN